MNSDQSANEPEREKPGRPDPQEVRRAREWWQMREEILEPVTISEPSRYNDSTDGPVQYWQVTQHGGTLGYLWASATDDAAGFVERVDTGPDGFNAGSSWYRRLLKGKEAGLPPLQAVRRWIGVPEDADEPEAGVIRADAVEEVAHTLQDLKDLAGWEGKSVLDYGFWEPGEPPANESEIPQDYPRYNILTESPVRYLPITRSDALLGYLWVSVDNDAIGFIAIEHTARREESVFWAWEERLEEAKADGLDASQAFQRLQRMPEHPELGGVADDVTEQRVSSVGQVYAIAGHEGWEDD